MRQPKVPRDTLPAPRVISIASPVEVHPLCEDCPDPIMQGGQSYIGSQEAYIASLQARLAQQEEAYRFRLDHQIGVQAREISRWSTYLELFRRSTKEQIESANQRIAAVQLGMHAYQGACHQPDQIRLRLNGEEAAGIRLMCKSPYGTNELSDVILPPQNGQPIDQG